MNTNYVTTAPLGDIYSGQDDRSPTDVTVLVDPNFLMCTEWSTTRVLIEVFLVLVLFENFFSIFVIATTAERRGNPYIIRCIRLINISNLLMVLQLLFYPFFFSWSQFDDNDHDSHDHTEDHDHERNTEDFVNITDEILEAREAEVLLHPCQQVHSAACKISGLIFGLVLFLPLLAVVLMTIDTALAAFRWKMYRFRPERASAIRISLFVGFSAAIVASFLFPTFGLGTHYHYHNLFKICWISAHHRDYAEKGFTYFIFGYGCFLVFLACFFGYLVLKAYQTECSPLRQMTQGHQCKLLFGRYLIMKSRSWISYVRFVLWMDLIVIATYFPLMAGYLVIFGLNLMETYWFNLVTEFCVFFIPTSGPLMLVFFYQSHRERAVEVLWWCYDKSFKSSNQRVSPTPSTSTSSDTTSDSSTESGFRATKNHSPGPKLYSDSLKKQLEEEEKRGKLQRFIKHDQLRHPAFSAKRGSHPTIYFPEPEIDIYGRNSHQKPFKAASREKLPCENLHRRHKELPLPESIALGLPRAALSQRRRSYEIRSPFQGQPKHYSQLHLSPARKRRSPRKSSERNAAVLRYRQNFLAAPSRFDGAENVYNDTNLKLHEGKLQRETGSNAHLSKLPPPYQVLGNVPAVASAFNQVDEQGYMWSADHLKLSTSKPFHHHKKRQSKDGGSSTGSSSHHSSKY